MTTRLRLWSAMMLVAGLIMAAAPVILANTSQPPLHVGRIWHNPEYDGAEGWDGSALQYPGGIAKPGDPWTSSNSLKRGWVAQAHKLGSYLMTTDWTDPDAVVHPWASSYMFRSYNYDSYGSDDWLTGSADVTLNYLYPGGVQVYRRWERPRIIVNAVEQVFHPGDVDTAEVRSDAGTRPYPLDIIDPDLVAEQDIYMWWRYIQGVEYQRHEYAYPMGSAHQDYFIMDINLVNNGISGVSEAAPVLTSQALTSVVWTQAYDFKNKNAETGGQQHWDNHAMFTDPWGNGNNVLYWHDGNAKDLIPTTTVFDSDDWGDPTTNAAYDGHLLGNVHVMWGPLFVSESAAAKATNLLGQPLGIVITGERGLDFAGKTYSPASAEAQREIAISGDYALPADMDYRDDALSGQWGDPNTGDGATGGTMVASYGPLNAALSFANMGDQGWDLGWEESVRVVQVIAGGGLDRNSAQVIGKAWNERRVANPTGDWFTADEIAAIATGEDTVRKAVNLAYWAFNGEFAANVTQGMKDAWGIGTYAAAKPAGYGEFDVPDAPRAPGAISARARAVDTEGGGVALRFSTEAETDLDHDTDVADFSHYRIYRQEGSRVAPWEIIADNVSASGLAMANAGDNGVDFAGRIYWDKAVTAGVDYWYSVVAVDDGSQNWAEAGVALESSPWWTWTGYSETGVTATTPTPPGAVVGTPGRFALSQNAPNPFNPATTISFEVPTAGEASLVIYGPTGQVVRTLIDGTVEAGQHSVTWNGLDNFGRPAASGVYIYRLASGNEVAHQRMVLVK